MGRDGIRNIVIGCPPGVWRNDRVEGDPRALGEFYAVLLGWTVIRDDWIKVGTALDEFPHLAFGDGWSGWSLREQGRVDLLVRDAAAAADRATASGGSVVSHGPEGSVVTDPYGHEVGIRPARESAIDAVVLDCPPGGTGGMSSFYEVLLGSLTGIAFREVDGFVPTTWPAPEVPAQIHLDLQFADRDAAVAQAQELGARRLPSPQGHGWIFADPAGHPVCFCDLTGN